MDLLCNEKELLLELTRGSEEAFASIYKFYSQRLYHKVIRILKSESNTREVLQDVFLKIWNNRAHIDPEKSFGCYITCIAANNCYDFFRKLKRDKQMHDQFLKLLSEKYSHIEEGIASRERAEILNRAINSLPEKRRRIFLLCKYDGKSYSEVSRELGISTSTISDHIVKANHFIRNYLLESLP